MTTLVEIFAFRLCFLRLQEACDLAACLIYFQQKAVVAQSWHRPFARGMHGGAGQGWEAYLSAFTGDTTTGLKPA